MRPIVLDQVSFKRNETIIFKHLDYEFSEGTFTLLRGDSGSGKSTLLKLIAGFAELPYEGDALVLGKNQKDLLVLERASKVGMVFQNPNQQFTMGTLRREITFALENLLIGFDGIQERIQEAVQLTQTNHLLDRELSTLSGGEKQRASLAVLLAMDTPILLLDEPFASVDPKSRDDLIQLLVKLKNKGKTILLCDHDLANYQNRVDKVVTLTQVGLVEEPLSILNKLPDPILSKHVTSKTSLLTLKDVGYSQGQRELLRPTDFSFFEGITTLTGDNGTGKSTLLKAMAQQKKYRGKMSYQNERIRSRRKWYQKMTLAVQDASQQFVCLTPEEELTFNVKLNEEQQLKQREVLESLDLIDKLKGSLFHLSEGQKKMIQLTAMLSLEKELLLLDEPFTGLDEKACQIFMDWMKEKEQHFVIVSHRLAPLSENSDHHVILANQELYDTQENLEWKGAFRESYQNQYA
ncbi:ABC transporter ATP-binding protein [Vagococcus carniphilus]|uniref:ABC transporter ATP-binding protein n=1 Tax=Vagococcus carniphilus TaxID=218144 RepID=UPI003B5AA822